MQIPELVGNFSKGCKASELDGEPFKRVPSFRTWQETRFKTCRTFCLQYHMELQEDARTSSRKGYAVTNELSRQGLRKDFGSWLLDRVFGLGVVKSFMITVEDGKSDNGQEWSRFHVRIFCCWIYIFLFRSYINSNPNLEMFMTCPTSTAR